MNRLISLLIVILISFGTVAQNIDWKWIKSGGGNGTWAWPDPELDDKTSGIVTDRYGNTTICGQIHEATLPNIDGQVLSKYGQEDGFVAQFDCQGNLKWAFSFGASLRDEASGITCDSLGNTYVAGITGASSQVSDSIYFNDTTIKINGVHAFIAKLDTAGKVKWIHFAYSGQKGVYSIAVSIDCIKGKVNYLLWSSGWFKEFAPGDTIDPGYIIASYSLSGDLLNVFKVYDYSSRLELRDISVDNLGNNFIAGSLRDSINIQGISYTTNVSGEVIVLKFSPAGYHNWGNTSVTGGPFGLNHSFELRCFKEKANSFILVGGAQKGTKFDGFTIMNSWIGNTGFIVKYENGSVSWLYNVRSSVAAGSSNYIYNVDVDENENIYVAGIFLGQIRVAGDTLNSSALQNPYIAKFDKFGNGIYAKNIPTDGSQLQNYPFGIAAGYNGNVFLTGTFESKIELPADSVYKQGGNTDFFVAKFGIDECEDTTTIDTTVGITDNRFDRNQMKVYPNPTSGQFTIELNKYTEGQIQIYNSLGSLVYSEVIRNDHQGLIDLPPNLKRGIYIVKLVTDDSISTQKLILN